MTHDEGENASAPVAVHQVRDWFSTAQDASKQPSNTKRSGGTGRLPHHNLVRETTRGAYSENLAMTALRL